MMPRKQRASVSWGLVVGVVLLVLTGCAGGGDGGDEGDAAARFSRVTLQVAPVEQLAASPSQTRQIRPPSATLQIDVTAGDMAAVKASCLIPASPTAGTTSGCDAVGTSEATLLVTDVTDIAVTVTVTLLVPTGNQRRIVATILDTAGNTTFQGETIADLPDTQSTFNLPEPIALNGAPLPIAQPLATAKDVAGTRQVDPNDYETAQTHVFAISSPAANGIATIDASGVLTYTPNAGFVGTDRVTVRVTDNGTPPLSGTVDIDITIVGLSNQTFTFANSDIFGLTGETTLSFGTFDASGTAPVTLSVTGSSDLATGTATIASLDIVFTQSTIPGIAPGPTFSFALSINSDGSLHLTNTATGASSTSAPPVPFVSNQPPVPTAPSIVTIQNATTPATSQVTAGDPDAGQSHTYTMSTLPAHGTASIDASGLVSYTPNADFVGSDTLAITVTDNGIPALSGTVTINVEVDLSPVVEPVSTPEDTVATRQIALLSTSPDLTAEFLLTTSPNNGTATVNATTGDVAYTPAPNFFGADSLTVTINVKDGTGALFTTGTVTFDITVTPVNDAPVALDDAAATNDGTAVVINVIQNDHDPDGDPLTVTVTQPPNGSVVSNGDGTIIYVPNAGFNGVDTVTYTIADPSGLTTTATVTITVFYDNFESAALDKARWRDLELIRKIQNGKLVSSIRQFGLRDPGDAANRLVLADQAVPVTAFEAEVTVTDVTNVDAFPAALLVAKSFNAFFSNPETGNGAAGDVVGFIGIGHNGTALVPFFGLLLCLDESCSARDVLHLDMTTLGSVTLNAAHLLSLAWDGTQFTFADHTNGTSALLDPLTVLPPSLPVMGDAKVPFADLRTRIFNQNPGDPLTLFDPMQGGTITATFDQVSINGTLFDNFDSSSMIDSAKWLNQERLREVQNGQLALSLRQVGAAGIPQEETENELEFRDPVGIKGMQADVTITNVSNSGAFPIALLGGAFYNDGLVVGKAKETGDVIAGIGIADDGSQLVVVFGVERCDDIGCVLLSPLNTTFGPVTLGQSYEVSLRWDGTNFIFGFAGNTKLFDPAPAVLPPVVAFPVDPFKGLSTQISGSISGGVTSPLAAGAAASIDATFDNVIVLDRQPTLTTIEGGVVDETGNPLAGAVVTAQDGQSGVTGSDGRFSIANVYAGGGQVAVSAEFTDPDTGLTYRKFTEPVLALIKMPTTVGDIDFTTGAILPMQIIRDTVVLQSDPFLIPAGVDTLAFEVNFLTNEFFEFGSVEGVVDDVSFALLRQNGTTLQSELLGSAKTSTFLTPDPIQVFGFNAQTGFRSIAMDVSALAGSTTPVRLLISVQDENDDVVSSALLIDNLRFVSAGTEQPIAELANSGFEDPLDGFSNFTLLCRQGAPDEPPFAAVVTDLGGVILPPSGGKMALLSTGAPVGLTLPPNRCP